MKTQSWISEEDGTVVLEVVDLGSSVLFRHEVFTVRIIRKTYDQITEDLHAENWYYTLEPGFGTFAHSAAKAVEQAKSEEESIMLAAITGHIPAFVFRFKENTLVSVKDTALNKIVWKNELQA